ncbi:dihydroorotate oxidase B electron transfer subunit [Balneicella halophila]|uniref:Dihydroorotate oxidase B electron transfer subunit n=1 Tax=Balneicella halophila TaxID=1537566 RepID=A0A7L4USV7_BALHA|nr:dihydroorotate dehydrogenase electron transfer subunit [Balneicella halophila]PVX52632.1 dihydroorotate oxidase B electron transfer subunit [Balneicella halophila]
MTKTVAKLSISEHKRVNDDHFILTLKKDGVFPEIKPGQFVNVLVEDTDVFLRRPFSIHDADTKQQSFSLLIKAVGKGTKSLQSKKVGDTLDVLFPLGNGYSLQENNKVLLVGGGFGIAPLYYLAKQLKDKVEDIHLLVGARSAKHILLTEKFDGLATVHITTEDESLGEKGYVTNHSILEDDFDKIYTCGPHPMTKALALYALNREISCEVSLENMMACGYGVCLCCVAETKTHENVTTCLQGPVFNAKELQW